MGTRVHGSTGARLPGCVGAGTDTKAASARLTANPGPAPLICCARQDQPSFKHWLPCAGLRWSCAGARALHGIQALVHSFAFTVFPPPLPHYHQCTTPPSPFRPPNPSLVTRRPTSSPCDRSVKIQLTHFSLPSPSKTLESTSLGRQQARLLPPALARSHSFPAGIACL